MDRAQPPTADASLEPALRCEDCGTARTDAEPGWVRVTYPAFNRDESDENVFLYYCPIHAGHFDLRDPGVVPASGND